MVLTQPKNATVSSEVSEASHDKNIRIEKKRKERFGYPVQVQLHYKRENGIIIFPFQKCYSL